MLLPFLKSFFNRISAFFASQDAIEIYTDGSEKNGRGSWAYVIVKNGQVVHEASGKERKVTSTQMEMRAAIEALQSLSEPTSLKLFSDSRILIDTMTLWRNDWKQNSWLKPSGVAIPNIGLIQSLDCLDEKHRIEWAWVKAHAGISFNERCDELCRIARESLG